MAFLRRAAIPLGISRRGVLGGAIASLAAGAVPSPGVARRRTKQPAHFVLVHGSFHGAWCWYKIVAALEAVGAAFASVRRFYVSCLRDRAVTPGFQRVMYTTLPCEQVFTIRSDHSPFFSRPAELLRILERIARA